MSSEERKRAGLLLGIILTMVLLDTLGVPSIMPFMAVLTNPEIIQENAILKAVYQSASQYLGINSTEPFLFALGMLVSGLPVISLAFKALTTYTQLRFTLMREYSIGKRLVEGYLHQPYSWLLNRHIAALVRMQS